MAGGGDNGRLPRRCAPDGNEYTRDEFVEFYGGTSEWDAAAQSEKADMEEAAVVEEEQKGDDETPPPVPRKQPPAVAAEEGGGDEPLPTVPARKLPTTPAE